MKHKQFLRTLDRIINGTKDADRTLLSISTDPVTGKARRELINGRRRLRNVAVGHQQRLQGMFGRFESETAAINLLGGLVGAMAEKGVGPLEGVREMTDADFAQPKAKMDNIDQIVDAIRANSGNLGTVDTAPGDVMTVLEQAQTEEPSSQE